MKKINRILTYSLLFITAVFSSCSKFDEINTNPDAATNASASMVATGVILSTVKFNGRDAMAFLEPNGLAKYIGFANQSQMPSQYNNLGNGSFGGMTLLSNVDKMVEYAKGTAMESSYKALGKFARAYMFYELTMQMGDIPYSAANQAMTGNYKPKYDAQKDVLIGVLNELKEADQLFATGVRFDGDPTPYNGDPVKWRKATNSFALKILMSMSKKANDNTLDIKKRFADIVSAGNILDANTGFLGLNYSAVNLHPLSGTNDLFTSRTVVSSLLIDNLKRLNDRRVFYFADPATAQTGAGKSESSYDAYVGVDVSIDYATMTSEYLKGKYSLLNSRYLKEFAPEPRMLITYAEQQLILAEARILNWISTGTADTYYMQGVKSALTATMNTKASYAHGMAIDQAYIDNYFTGENAFKATPDEQLKQIWLQRYILNFMQDPETSYFEYRRNGYPQFPINPSTNLNLEKPNAIPVRWLYPTSETNYNRENLIDALNRQYGGYDEINKLMWVLQ